MLDRKYKPKTKKRKLHKRTRKHVKQFGGAKKPLGNTVLPPKITVKNARKFFETRMHPTTNTSKPPSNVSNLKGSRIVSKIVAGLQGAPQLPHRAYKTRKGVSSNKNIYTSPKSFYDVTNSTSRLGSTYGTYDTYDTTGPHTKFYSIASNGSSASNPYAFPNPSAIYESVNQPNQPNPNHTKNPIYDKNIYENPGIYNNHVYENPEIYNNRIYENPNNLKP